MIDTFSIGTLHISFVSIILQPFICRDIFLFNIFHRFLSLLLTKCLIEIPSLLCWLTFNFLLRLFVLPWIACNYILLLFGLIFLWLFGNHYFLFIAYLFCICYSLIITKIILLCARPNSNARVLVQSWSV